MYKILSLDGGGLKGLYTIKILEIIEKEYNIKIHEYFDLIIGTSTGSIIATLLSLGKSPKEIWNIYISCYNEIFSTTKVKKRQKGLFSEMYSSKKLHESIEKYLENYDYEDLKTDLIVPSVDYTNSKINLVKSSEEKLKDLRFKLSDAIIASSSASGFFNPHLVNGNMYIDGSIYCNNPSLIGFSEAFSKGVKFEDIKILSVGTGYAIKKYGVDQVSNSSLKNIFGSNFLFTTVLNSIFNSSENDFGLISMGFSLVDVTMKTNIEATEYILNNMCKEEQYVRINDFSNNLKLDEMPKELINKLEENYINIHKNKLNKFFENKQNKSWFKKGIFKLAKKMIEYSEN